MEPDQTLRPEETGLKEWDSPVFQELPVSASEASIVPTGTDGPFNYS
jgi:hypothetical protein